MNQKHNTKDESSTHLRIIAEQAKLIQALVDALYYEKRPWPQEKRGSALDTAAAAGFKPSEQ